VSVLSILSLWGEKECFCNPTGDLSGGGCTDVDMLDIKVMVKKK